MVLDCFAGAGTTAEMAMLNGRRWLGFKKINAEYVAIGHERLRKGRTTVVGVVSNVEGGRGRKHGLDPSLF